MCEKQYDLLLHVASINANFGVLVNEIENFEKASDIKRIKDTANKIHTQLADFYFGLKNFLEDMNKNE